MSNRPNVREDRPEELESWWQVFVGAVALVFAIGGVISVGIFVAQSVLGVLP